MHRLTQRGACLFVFSLTPEQRGELGAQHGSWRGEGQHRDDRPGFSGAREEVGAARILDGHSAEQSDRQAGLPAGFVAAHLRGKPRGPADFPPSAQRSGGGFDYPGSVTT